MAAISKYTNTGGKLRTLSLFWEMASFNSDKSECLYTLRGEDTYGLPSLKRLYLEESDPTEYAFANKHLASWDHWQALISANWFQPHIARWRIELDLKLRADALGRLRTEAASGSKNSYQANKFLAEGGWLPKEPRKRVGRPSKDLIKQEAILLLDHEKAILEDHNRLN